MARSLPFSWLVFIAGLSSIAWASCVTVTRLQVSTILYHETTTSPVFASDYTEIDGDLSFYDYPYPTDVYRTTVTATTYFETLTFTEVSTPKYTLSGTSATTSFSFSAGEKGVQDTLPGATYYFKEAGADPAGKLKARDRAAVHHPRYYGGNVTAPTTCTANVTVTQYPTTITLTSTKTVTTTLHGTYIEYFEIFGGSSTTRIPLSAYTRPTTYTSTSTLTYTTSTRSISEIIQTASTTATVYQSTQTIFAACAETNWADAYQIQGGYYQAIVSPSAPAATSLTVSGVDSAYDCCSEALMNAGAGAVWMYGDDVGCNFYNYQDAEDQCNELWNSGENDQVGNFTVYYDNPVRVPVKRVVGNGYCAQINNALPVD